MKERESAKWGWGGEWKKKGRGGGTMGERSGKGERRSESCRFGGDSDFLHDKRVGPEDKS